MNTMQWNHLPSIETNRVKLLSKELNNLDLTLTEILIQRGIDTFEKAKTFLGQIWVKFTILFNEGYGFGCTAYRTSNRE